MAIKLLQLLYRIFFVVVRESGLSKYRFFFLWSLWQRHCCKKTVFTHPLIADDPTQHSFGRHCVTHVCAKNYYDLLNKYSSINTMLVWEGAAIFGFYWPSKFFIRNSPLFRLLSQNKVRWISDHQPLLIFSVIMGYCSRIVNVLNRS